jgi:hypothetical protein
MTDQIEQNIYTIKQFILIEKCFTESSLRALLFSRDDNGLASSVIQLGRRIYINRSKFHAWLEIQQQKNQKP